MTDAQKIERLKRALRIIQTWAACDGQIMEPREKAMKDIQTCAMRALEDVE